MYAIFIKVVTGFGKTFILVVESDGSEHKLRVISLFDTEPDVATGTSWQAPR